MANRKARYQINWRFFVALGCVCTAIVLGGSIYGMRTNQDSIGAGQLAAGAQSNSPAGIVNDYAAAADADASALAAGTATQQPNPNAPGNSASWSAGELLAAADGTEANQASPGPTIGTALAASAATAVPNATGSDVQKLRIRMAGDVIAHGPQLDTAHISGNEYDFSPSFSLINNSMSVADFTLANFESTCLGEPGSAGYTGYPRFHTPPQMLQALKDIGVDMLTLCNNHAVDRFLDGLVATIDTVESYGFEHVGTYRSQEEYDAPNVIEINGIRVGFMAYTDNINHKERYVDADRLAYSIKYIDGADFAGDAQKLRDGGAEVIIALPHWGIEYERKPTDAVRQDAKEMAEAGVDIIIGSHPHMVQPIEWMNVVDNQGNERRTLVVYSLGNFISNQRDQYTDTGIIVDLTINYNRTTGEVVVDNVGYVPTWVWRWETSPDHFEYRVLPCGYSIANKPNGISDENYARLKAAYQETVDLIGNTIATPLDV